MTQHYVFDESDSEGNNQLKWAIAIFEKLREFVVVGNVKEFFLRRIDMYSEDLKNMGNPNAYTVRTL